MVQIFSLTMGERGSIQRLATVIQWYYRRACGQRNNKVSALDRDRSIDNLFEDDHSLKDIWNAKSLTVASSSGSVQIFMIKFEGALRKRGKIWLRKHKERSKAETANAAAGESSTSRCLYAKRRTIRCQILVRATAVHICTAASTTWSFS